MSTEHHKPNEGHGEPATHKDVAFESADINTRTILTYLLYLGLSVVVAFAVSVYIFRIATKVAVSSETQMVPVHQGVGATMPPEPRLQGVPGHITDPQFDLRAKMKEDSEANDKLEYVDKQAGIAQIPVEEAMKILVSKGLSTAPAAEAEKKK